MITWKRIDQKVPCMQIISLVVERIFIKKFSISLVDFLKKKKKGGGKKDGRRGSNLIARILDITSSM